jgi:hypothetical protein
MPDRKRGYRKPEYVRKIGNQIRDRSARDALQDGVPDRGGLDFWIFRARSKSLRPPPLLLETHSISCDKSNAAAFHTLFGNSIFSFKMLITTIFRINGLRRIIPGKEYLPDRDLGFPVTGSSAKG